MKLFFAAVLVMPLFSLAQNSAEPHFLITGRVAELPVTQRATDVKFPSR